MTIEIGNKPLKEITAGDLLEIVIIEGCCPAIVHNGEKIWAKPVVTDFNNKMFSDTLFLDYHSYRISDNMKSSEYVFFFNYKSFRFHYTKDYNENKNQESQSNRASIETIKYLISKGYDVPVY